MLLGTLANKVVPYIAYLIIGLTCYAVKRKGERERDSPPIYQEASVFFSRSVTVFMQQRYYLLEYPFE